MTRGTSAILTGATLGLLLLLIVMLVFGLSEATTTTTVTLGSAVRPIPQSTAVVASEVCEHNGAVRSVVLVGDAYEVTCHSDVIVWVARR